MRRILFGASLLAFVILSGCSSFSGFDFSPTVDRQGQPVVEGEKSEDALAFVQPVQAALLWTLNYAPLNGADVRGLQVTGDEQYLYLAMPNGMVTAFHRSDQPTWVDQVAWQLLLDSPVLGGPLLHEGVLFVGTADGQLVAIEGQSGRVKWARQLSSSVDAPLVVADNRLLVRTLDSQLYAVRLRDGEIVWQTSRAAPALALQGESAPVLWQDKVIVGWENGEVEALDWRTGNTLWRQRLAIPQGRDDLARMVDVQAQPFIQDGRLYVAAFHGKLAAMDPDRGLLYWVKDLSSYRDMALFADRLVSVDDDDQLLALDLITGARIWQRDELKHRQLTDLRRWPATDQLVVGDQAGWIHWIEPLNGQVAGRMRHHSKPVVKLFPLDDNQMIVIDGEGYLSLYQVSISHE